MRSMSTFSLNFTSESELLTVTVAVNPVAVFIIRVMVVLLSLVALNTASYLYLKCALVHQVKRR